MPDTILEMPKEVGLYWYFCEALNDFRPCEVKEKNGSNVARFTDGSFQRWVGKKSYFVGPIPKPVIGENGTIK
tara:strand:+ start:240 stop:458 length:219 start_codon:yes stop_codon:yes gene_type:complete